jgi:hypothetical protein
MRFITRFAERRRLRRFLSVLKSGRLIHYSFQPLRRGVIRAALGRDALELTWHQDRKVLSLYFNGVAIPLRKKKDHQRVIDLALLRVRDELDRNASTWEKHLPILVGVRIKRRLSVLAMRLAEAIRAATTLFDQRDRNGFGAIKVVLPNLLIELHMLEGGLLPSVRVNKMDALRTSSDIRYIARAIQVRLRHLRRRPIEPFQAAA